MRFAFWVLVDIEEVSRVEGDNFVLDGQVVRAATKLCNAVLSSTSDVTNLPLPSAYLRLLSANSAAPPQLDKSPHQLGTTSQMLYFFSSGVLPL